ncbi:MAG: ATP-binding protein [Candidatus Electrothrix sp. AU1_5]|nr:ATP-binding protein [Candidatus Electrothrix gigas]
MAEKEEAKGTPCTSEEVHQFLAHFVLIQFDFLREGATDPPDAINRIRDCLTPDNADKAPLLWSKFAQLARASAGKAGQFDRARLVRRFSPIVRFRGATSFRHDLDTLTQLAESYVNLIPDDIGGVRLNRTSLIKELNTKLSTARLVQIRGLPGSGKSVVVRRAVQRALENGPVLFLKAEQLEGTSWISYATSQGLSGVPLEKLLVEIGATGTPIFFIDAIDRVEKEYQPVILDIIRTIVDSPILNNWRVIVSLRDTGIEVLRNWLGNFLDALGVETIKVDQLNDEDAKELAKAKPHLRPLLFGAEQVKEIVRRPFFAKVLNQSYVADPNTPTFAPQSEVDLIENWWQRGGYNATGQHTVDRQQELLALASVRAHNLSQPIRLSQLTSRTHIDDLRSDGILQNAREGVSVRFAHDIFFEWAFFYVLTDRGSQWMDEIKECGEPPAISRVVELLSQWEYAHGEDWSTYLEQAENSALRSQWLRAWLAAPLGTSKFEVDEKQFATAVFADDFRLFRKELVWFQAEKITPNTNILSSELPPDQRQRSAYLFGWPSDFIGWHRLIGFILRHITEIPQSFYPEVVAIFEVWQNALSDLPNPTSHALLQQCASWLATIDTNNNSLVQLLLKASRAEPTFAADYLQRVINSERISEKTFGDIIAFSSRLAESLPELVVDLSLAFLKEELPDNRVVRRKQEMRTAAEKRKIIQAKPEAERTRQEQMMLTLTVSFHSADDFSSHDWERLSLQDDSRSFYPPSPLQEPFHSLFQSAPDEALRLLREICNHAITAWRQLHSYSRDRSGTPIPLELTFPWGSQKFWGGDREYSWLFSPRAPKAISCALMALEEWCFAELERNRPVDELIRKIVEGNECIAILGVASMVALHTETVSEVTFPLVTSQRLLAADQERLMQCLSSPEVNPIGFTDQADSSHFKAVQAANARPVRKTQLSCMVPRFVLAAGPIADQARDAILNFKNDLPFQYEEHRNIAEAQEDLTAQATKYAELADPKNYKAYRTKEESDEIAIVHVSPSAAEPENIAKAEETSTYLSQTGLWIWASQSFKERAIQRTYTVEDAIAIAKEADINDLFTPSNDESEEYQQGTVRGAIAGTAAIVLNFREKRCQEETDWARDVLGRAIRLPEKPGIMWSPHSAPPWHHAIYVARGFAADIRENTAADNTACNLLRLIAHPIEVVSSAAIEEICKLWSNDPKLTWAGLILAFSLCHLPPWPRDKIRQQNETKQALEAAIDYYENGNGWASLPLPPPAWVKVKSGETRSRHQQYDQYNLTDMINPAEVWGEPDVFWSSKQAAEILQRIPFDDILNSNARNALLDFLAGTLDWTIQKSAPLWVQPGRRNRTSTQLFEWTRTLAFQLGYVAGLLPFSYFQDHFLEPILGLEGDNCWAFLTPFTRSYICNYVYDAPTIPSDAVALLALCLERLLQDPTFKHNTYRSGELFGAYLPELVRTLMFVSVERANLAARYVNGDWSEIDRILPLIDRFVRAGGWAASVMHDFLTLCERAKAHYPAEDFANQVFSIIDDRHDHLKGWHDTFIPARIAELVQHFAHRDTPMKLDLAQKFLRILDILVDMGDRRSAALQLSEVFREVKVPS